jgi:hypothetical protein
MQQNVWVCFVWEVRTDYQFQLINGYHLSTKDLLPVASFRLPGFQFQGRCT